MGTILDIVMSVMLGGVLLLIIMTATDVAAENVATTYGDRYVQEALLSITQQVEGDFRNMGFGVPDSQRIVTYADSQRISFRSDLRPFGSVDTVTYWVGPISELASTTNELDRYLYRRQGNGAARPVGIVTDFRLRFIDREFKLIPLPVADTSKTRVHNVEMSIEVQNPQALHRPRGSVGTGEREALYSSIAWKQTRLVLQNLDR